MHWRKDSCSELHWWQSLLGAMLQRWSKGIVVTSQPYKKLYLFRQMESSYPRLW